MSKSMDNFISRDEIAEICEEYSADVYRYYLLRAVTFGSDGDFSRQVFRERYNGELANGIGNLLSRTLKMIGKYFDGVVPAPGETTGAEGDVIAAATKLRESAEDVMNVCAFGKYLDLVASLASATNVYIERTQPFKLAGDDAQAGRLGTILYTCAEALRLIMLYLRPVMPETSGRALAMLGVPADDTPLDAAGAWGKLAFGTRVQKGSPLFPRKQ